jgi:hypothetical protein
MRCMASSGARALTSEAAVTPPPWPRVDDATSLPDAAMRREGLVEMMLSRAGIREKVVSDEAWAIHGET